MATSHSQLDCPKATANGYMKLRISLAHTNISRIIAVPEHMTLADLNDAIQAVMGWDDSHLWHFTDCKRDGAIYELPHDDDRFPPFSKRLTVDASKIMLRKVFPDCGAKLYYEYDFGDGWEHLITRQTDPKTPEISCVKTVGPDGIEDFGGQWRLGAFVAAMHADPDNENYSEIRQWAGLDTAEDLKKYLDGETAAEKTDKLRAALSHVKAKDKSKVASAMPMTEDEQASKLGMIFALIASSQIWRILDDAMRNGGTCEFDDPNKNIGEYFLTMFEGLKVKDGRSTFLNTEPSRLTVLPEWVEMYKKHGDEWRKMHEQFDILESYASSAVHLYGVISLDELYGIILRYDPGCKVSQDELSGMLEARAVSCPGMSFRIVGNLVISEDIFPMDIEDIDDEIDEFRKVQCEYPRWYPMTRDEFFTWEHLESFTRTPESDSVEHLLRTVCRADACYDSEEALFSIYHLLAQPLKPETVCDFLHERDILPELAEKQKRELLDLMDRWSEVIHMPSFNGNTVKDLRTLTAQHRR